MIKKKQIKHLFLQYYPIYFKEVIFVFSKFKELVRKFNDSRKELIFAPFRTKLICFLVGFLGLEIVSILLSFILEITGAISQEKIEMMSPMEIGGINAYFQLATYSIVFIILLSIFGPKLIKIVAKQFADEKFFTKVATFAIIILLANYFCGIISQIIGFPPNNHNQEEINRIVIAKPLVSFIAIVLIGPIVEEITYRFGLFGSLYQKNRLLAYMISILFFWLIHFDFSSIGTNNFIYELAASPAYISAGLILCIAYEKTENLAVPILAHMCNNLLSFLAILLIP